MADNQSIVTLNIGSQRIGMAVFEAGKNGGLVLKGYESSTIPADPAMDALRVTNTKQAVAELVKRLKVSGTKIRYAISGQSVLSRFVKLPPIQEENVEQLVTFEAQSQFPFPLNEVVWDYELIDSGSEKEAVIVAIKSDALDEINHAVNEAGVGTMEIDVSPMALYNAFRATYGQPSETILILDMGAKSSNLLYTEGKRFFTRSINIGGSAVTSAIAKEYHVSFDEAEQTKVSTGLVALAGGHTEQLEESVAALAMVIRNALTRLPAEITRTNNYYRSQHGGNAPQRMLLCGGGANLPYMLEFLQEKLGMPVEYFNPVQNVSIGKSVDSAVIQREGHLMGELVGLALRGTGKSEINIDLVPGSVENERAAARRKPYFIGAAALLLGGMLLWAIFQNLAAKKSTEEVANADAIRETLAPKVDHVNRLLKEESEIRAIADGYTDLEVARTTWPDVLAELRGAFASDAVWITDMQPLADYDIAKVTGKPLDAKEQEKNGKPLVKDAFDTVKYGDSPLVLPKAEEKAPPKKGMRPEPVKAPELNAVRISGYWRDNPKSEAAVVELLNRLRQKSTLFSLKTTGEDGKEVPIEDTRLISVRASTIKSEDAAAPFVITLPLARPIPLR